MTEKRRRKIIYGNMRGAADIAKKLINFTPAEKVIVFFYLWNMFSDRAIYKQDFSDFNSAYIDGNLNFLFESIKEIDEHINENKIYRVCDTLTQAFRNNVDVLQNSSDSRAKKNCPIKHKAACQHLHCGL